MVAPGRVAVVGVVEASDSVEELGSNPQSSGATEGLDTDGSVLLHRHAVLPEQHVGGGGGEAVQAEDREVLMVDLLLLCLLRQDPLGGLDAGQDPGLALVCPVGAHPKTDLLRVGVRLVIPGQLEHLYRGGSGHVTEPAIRAGPEMFI